MWRKQEAAEDKTCVTDGSHGQYRFIKSIQMVPPLSWPKRSATHKPAAGKPGQHTLREILSQPDAWRETALQLGKQGTITRLAKMFSAREPWLFLACGSSYYLAQTVASAWRREHGMACECVPASEFLFAPEETLRRTGAKQIALVSRSGETTEVLRAATILQTEGEVRTLGVTCHPAGPLDGLCHEMMKLTWADEKSMVMTRSFTSILLAFQRLGARVADDQKMTAALDRLPEKVQAWLEENAVKIRALVAKKKFADFVFLGQGAHYWLAQEGALKLTEMSSSYAQAYHSLEFRHGPKSIAGPETLITILISDAAKEEEASLVMELKRLGAATVVVVNRATPALRRDSDVLIELNLDEAEHARLAPTAIPAQLLGAAVGLRKKLNPDTPKNLKRSVILETNSAATKRRGA